MSLSPVPLRFLRVLVLSSFACGLPCRASAAPPAPLPPVLDPVAVRRWFGDAPPGQPGDLPITLAPGVVAVFHMQEAGMLPPGLARRYPTLHSLRGRDDTGRSLRLDLSPSGIRASLREPDAEWVFRPGAAARREPVGVERATTTEGDIEEPATRPVGGLAPAPAPANNGNPRRRRRSASGVLRHDFRLAVAASSRYVAAVGGTRELALSEIVHNVNRANEVFETDLGVHFTLAERTDQLIRVNPKHDIFATHDPAPAAAILIDRAIGAANYDVGHAFTTLQGGDSHIGTSCSDDRKADFLATHKAAAWSGDSDPTHRSDGISAFIHVLGRQLGAWPTANGCRRDTLDDRAVEPGGGHTAMGYAWAGCASHAVTLHPSTDRYFHAVNMAQVHDWLASRGGQCAARRIVQATAPWIDPASLADLPVIPARTPFILDALVEPGMPGRHLTYTWEQLDTGDRKRGLPPHGTGGPLFRSLPPSPHLQRVLPRMAVVLGHVPADPGEVLPTTSRDLRFRLTVRDNGGPSATTTGADTRLRVIDTGRPFAIRAPATGTLTHAGGTLDVMWDVAATNEAPIDCHFLIADLSLDSGLHWQAEPLGVDVTNNGSASLRLPGTATTTHARVRLRCDWRPFFAVSTGDFIIRPAEEGSHP